jgi:hypothetical protein
MRSPFDRVSNAAAGATPGGGNIMEMITYVLLLFDQHRS